MLPRTNMHPRLMARGTRSGHPESTTQVIGLKVIHAIVYAPSPDRRQWVERELAHGPTTVQVASDVAEVVSVLVGDGPHAQMLVIDIDALSAGELLHVHQIREHGWCGTIVALGLVPPSLRHSLKVARAIPPPFVEAALTDEVVKHRCATEGQTARIPVVR